MPIIEDPSLAHGIIFSESDRQPEFIQFYNGATTLSVKACSMESYKHSPHVGGLDELEVIFGPNTIAMKGGNLKYLAEALQAKEIRGVDSMVSNPDPNNEEVIWVGSMEFRN